MMMFRPLLVSSNGLANSLQAKGPLPAGSISAACGRLHRLLVTNTNAAARFVQLFDATALPADGAFPASTNVLVLEVGAGTTPPAFDFGPSGWEFVNGLFICNSTTAGTKTIGGADMAFMAWVS